MAVTQSYVRVPPDSTGKLVDTFVTGGNAHERQCIVIGDPEVDGQYVSIGTNGRLPVVTETQIDYDTTTTATSSLSMVGVALPSVTGPVAGGTSTNPFNVTGILTGGTLSNVIITGGTLGNVTVQTCALPTGAATAAIQTAQLAILQTTGIVVATNVYASGMASSTQQLNVIGSKAGGTAATSSQLVGGVYNATPPTLTDGQQSGNQFDANGNLKVTFTGNIGGTSAVDKTTFTSGATSLTPVGGIYQSTTVTTLTESQVGVARLTQYRAQQVALYDTVGAPIVTLPVSVAAGVNVTVSNVITATVTNAVLTSWDDTARAKVNPIVGSVGVAGGTGTDSASTQRVTLATNVALPAGTNAIGKLSANSGVIIGDVNVVSNIPGTGDTALGKAEDATHTSGATGVMFLGVRQDTQATLSSTTGDYATPTLDQNNGMYVRPSYGPVLSERLVTTIGTSTVFTNFAAVASQRNFVTAISAYRTDTGTGQEYVDIRDGSAGAILWTVPLPPGGGATISGGANPLFRGTANTALAYDVSANLSSVIISMSGFQGFQ